MTKIAKAVPNVRLFASHRFQLSRPFHFQNKMDDASLLQLVASDVPQEHGKTVYVSRVKEVFPDPESGSLFPVVCRGLNDSYEGLFVIGSGHQRLAKNYVEYWHGNVPRYWAFYHIHALAKNSKMLQMLHCLPLPEELQDYIQSYVGYQSLGWNLPRCFVRANTWGIQQRDNPPLTFAEDIAETSQLLFRDVPRHPAQRPPLAFTEPQLLVPYDDKCFPIRVLARYVILVKKSDLLRDPLVILEQDVNGNIVSSVQGIWLLCFAHVQDDWVILPFLPLIAFWSATYIRMRSSWAMPIYLALTLPRTEVNVESNPPQWYTQVQEHAGKHLWYENDSVSNRSLLIKANICTSIRLILCFQNRPVRVRPNAKFSHPIKTIRLKFHGQNAFSQDGEYFRTVTPYFYNEVPNMEYVIYNIIFSERAFNSQSAYMSTCNFHRIDDVDIIVQWDEDVLREQFCNPEQVNLRIYSEGFNVLVHQHGLIAQRYWN